MRTLIERGGGPELFFKKSSDSHDCLTGFSRQMILDNRSKTGVFEEDLRLILDWGKHTHNIYEMPDRTEWTPGYGDYEEIIAELTAKGRDQKQNTWTVSLDGLLKWPRRNLCSKPRSSGTQIFKFNYFISPCYFVFCNPVPFAAIQGRDRDQTRVGHTCDQPRSLPPRNSSFLSSTTELKGNPGMASRQSRGSVKSAAKLDPDGSPESLQFFLASIRDPHKPKHCGKCLLGAFLSFTIAERKSVLTGTPAQKSATDTRGNLDLWRTVHAFLFTKRTDEQLEKLLRRLSQCSCSFTETNVRWYHNGAKLAAGKAMERSHMDVVSPKEKLALYTTDRCAFIVDLFLVLDAVVQQSGVVSVAKRSSTAWPTTPIDLVPFGADSLVESLIQWYKFVPDTIIFKLTAHILRVTRFLLIPSLVKLRFSRIVVEAARTLADCSVLALDSSDSQARQRIAEIFPYHISDLLVYITQTGQHMPTDCRAELIRGTETKAMQVYCMLLYINEDPKMPKITHRPQGNVILLAAEVQHLFRFFHMHMYPRPDIPLHPKAVSIDRTCWPPPASIRNSKATACAYISAFREETRCSAYMCTNSLQSEGRNFQRCARCNVVSYCGRECQAKAWREEKYPHKKVCPVLRNLIQLGGGIEVVCGLWGQMGVWECWVKAGVHEDDFQLIEDWSKLTCGVYKMPDGTEWTPGYDDYEEIIAKLTARGRGAKALYMNRLARWPSEVAKEKALLQDQVFWDTDMDV